MIKIHIRISTLLLALIILSLTFLCSCSETEKTNLPDNFQRDKENLAEKTEVEGGWKTGLCLLESGMISIDNKTTDIDSENYYICYHDFQSGNVYDLLKLTDWKTIGGSQRIYHNTFYFCVNYENCNILYGMDLDSLKITEIEKDTNYHSFNYMTVFNDQLLIIRGDMDKKTGEISTWVEIVNNEKSKQKIITKTGNQYTSTGASINNLACNENLYVYCEAGESGKIVPMFEIYDENFNFQGNIDLSELYDSIFYTVMDEMVFVQNDLLFMRNFSGESLLMNSEETRLYSMDENLCISECSLEGNDGFTRLLFYRGTNSIIYPEGESLKEKELELEDGLHSANSNGLFCGAKRTRCGVNGRLV